MINNVEKFVYKYIEQCMKLCTKQGDYTAANVKRHNKAMDTLAQYAEELAKTPELAQEVFSQLLVHESRAVRLSSAAKCLKYGFCNESAIEVLQVLGAGEDMCAFSAEMTLKVWQGEIPGTKL